MVIMEVLTVDSVSLRALLDRDVPDCLVLDCRSFLSFNSSHISGSSNVRFSTIVRRRARGGLGLEHIVPNEDTRNRLLSGDYKSVVLLDDRSLDLGQVKKDGTLMLAVTALCRDPCGANVYILKGKKRALKYFDTYDLLLTRGRQMWATAVTIPAGAKVKKAPRKAVVILFIEMISNIVVIWPAFMSFLRWIWCLFYGVPRHVYQVFSSTRT